MVRLRGECKGRVRERQNLCCRCFVGTRKKDASWIPGRTQERFRVRVRRNQDPWGQLEAEPAMEAKHPLFILGMIVTNRSQEFIRLLVDSPTQTRGSSSSVPPSIDRP
jgi:hypothetical protein